MTPTITDSDVACASAAFDLAGPRFPGTRAEQLALIANLFAEHREKAEASLRDVRAEKNELADLLAEIREKCDHEWEFVDDSFDHEYGTEVIHSWRCEKCGASVSRDPRPFEP